MSDVFKLVAKVQHILETAKKSTPKGPNRASYSKGDRVVVNTGTVKEPEYLTGTVVTLRKNGDVAVKFDDGDDGDYTPTKGKAGIVGKLAQGMDKKTDKSY